MKKEFYTLGIDIGSTTVKVAILDAAHHYCFLITSGITQISAKHYQHFYRMLMLNWEI